MKRFSTRFFYLLTMFAIIAAFGCGGGHGGGGGGGGGGSFARGLAGNYNGTWIKTTDGSNGTATMVITVNDGNRAVTLTLNLSDATLTGGTLAEFAGSYGSSGISLTLNANHPTGTLTIDKATGNITGSFTNFNAGDNITRIDVTGVADQNTVTFNLVITHTDGSIANGTITLNHVI